MLATERNLHSQKILQSVTEVDDASINTRRQLKGRFLEKDKLQMSSYIKDLEKTILLNKSIISDLLTSEKSAALYKKTIEKLNRENIGLQNKVKELVRERDNAQSRLLVCEQMIEELKSRENDIEQHCTEKSKEMIEQLDVKEYVLQSYERRFRKAMKLLQKYKERDINIRFFLNEVTDENDNKKSMTSVIEENEVLVKKVKKICSEISKYRKEINALIQENTDGLNIQLQEIAEEQNTSEGIPVSARQIINNAELNIKELDSLIVRLNTDKQHIIKTITKLRNENSSWKKLNAKLSQEFYDISDELRNLKGKYNFNHVSKKPYKRARKSSQDEKRATLEKEEDFGNVSSIVEDYKENEFFSFYQDINEEDD